MSSLKLPFVSINMNTLDRQVRAVFGLILMVISPLGTGHLGDGILGWFAFVFGLANVIAAIFGWCFMYSVVGLNSAYQREDNNKDDIPLDFSTLRNKTILGFGAIALVICVMYIGESYRTSKKIVHAMEVNQLHDMAEVTSDYLNDVIQQRGINAADVLENISPETLVTPLKRFEKPLIVGISDGDKWLHGSKNLSPHAEQQLLNIFSTEYKQRSLTQYQEPHQTQHIYNESNQALHNERLLAVGDKQFTLMAHTLLENNGSRINLYIAQQSDAVNSIFTYIVSQLALSSIVVIWLSLWGAVGVAYFIWRYIERSNREIEKAANTDSQTGFLNERGLRVLFNSSAFTKQNNQFRVAAVKFRSVSQIVANNSSEILSRLLGALADELRASLASTCVLARLEDGTLLLMTPDHDDKCLRVFREITQRVQLIDNYQFSLEPTEALLHYPKDADSLDQLISVVSILIVNADHQRISSIEYSDKLIRQSQKASEYAAGIVKALQNKQFELYYQPKIDMETGNTIGAEALVRWNHPSDGTLSPAQFMDIVDHSNMRAEFAKYIIEDAFKASSMLHSLGHDLRISFNLNSYDIFDAKVFETLTTIANVSPVPVGEMLEMELLESETSIAPSKIEQKLLEISALGYSIALDDFGTGMSSISFLHRLPINTLKIDRYFVSQLDTSETSQLPIKTVISMANNYRYNVVAEGVETAKQACLLQSLGVQIAQGYHFAVPMPFRSFVAELA